MSKHDYDQSKKIADLPFYALIMGAMRKADTWNAQTLASAFPEVWEELQERYNAPGGYLEGERPEPVSPANHPSDEPGFDEEEPF